MQAQQQANDFSHLLVKFSLETVENKQKTLEAGRPIYDELDRVTIRTAGDQKSVFVAPAHDKSAVFCPDRGRKLTYAELHAGPYEAFKQNTEYVGSGTPLSEVPFVTAGKVRELSALNVRTVEALAGLDGTLLTRLGMGARELKTQAQAWLDSASSNKDVQVLQEENKKLQEQMKELLSRLDGDTSPAPDGPVPATETDNEPAGVASPFEGFSKEDLRLYIIDQTGETPHPQLGEKKLLAKAEEIAANLGKE